MRQRMQLAPHEPDDEIVVVDVEAVAGQAYVVGEIGLTVSASEDAVLPDDRPLLLWRQPGETADATQRIPDAPRPRRIQCGTPRPPEQPVVEVRLEARRIRAPEHRELG